METEASDWSIDNGILFGPSLFIRDAERRAKLEAEREIEAHRVDIGGEG